MQNLIRKPQPTTAMSNIQRFFRAARIAAAVFVFAVVLPRFAAAQDPSIQEPSISGVTEACLSCHEGLHPGIVEAWKKSRHGRFSPAWARRRTDLKRRMSRTEPLEGSWDNNVVGCAECHTLRPKEHGQGTYEHNGFEIHTVVSPDDCATCHPVEREEYSKNLMAMARTNLADNATYQDMVRSILGEPALTPDGTMEFKPHDGASNENSCEYCHGTALKVTGKELRDTDFGELEFPVTQGWPNGGVGRYNLDNSKGSCTACHTRHQFNIETARKPYTYKECHVGPDVPVYKIWSASRHGKIYASHNKDWKFDEVPWVAGQHYTAPTCAACHVSLVVNTEGTVVAKRSHRMNNRLPWRQFGLVYAHSHPKNANTSIIRNKDNIQLPTAFDGTPAADYLIDAAEREQRKSELLRVCTTCHAGGFTQAFWQRFETIIKTTNQTTLAATRIMEQAWKEGYAKGPAQGGSPFDEYPEKLWGELWLFYANSVRMTAAMAGGGDYATFADGNYQLAKGVTELADWLKNRREARQGR